MKTKPKRENEQMTKSGSNALLLLEQFEAAVLDALEKAGLSSSVSVDFACCGAARRAVELDNISANTMRQGHGSKAMALITELADGMGVELRLRVANETDDIQEWQDDDPDRPPTETELVSWYERFGFEIFGLGFDTRMRRIPGMAPAPSRSP